MTTAPTSKHRPGTPSGTATLTYRNKSVELPILKGTVGPEVMDAQALRRDGRVHLRPGLHVDGFGGILHHLYRWR